MVTKKKSRSREKSAYVRSMRKKGKTYEKPVILMLGVVIIVGLFFVAESYRFFTEPEIIIVDPTRPGFPTKYVAESQTPNFFVDILGWERTQIIIEHKALSEEEGELRPRIKVTSGDRSKRYVRAE